jgi:hypothetical protein
LTSITNTVNSMQATINQARQDASWKSASYTIDSSAIGTTSEAVDLSDGTIGTTGVTVDLNVASTGGTASELVTSAAYAAPVLPQQRPTPRRTRLPRRPSRKR